MKSIFPIPEEGGYETPTVTFLAIPIEAGFTATSGGSTETMPEEGQDPWSSDTWSWK